MRSDRPGCTLTLRGIPIGVWSEATTLDTRRAQLGGAGVNSGAQDKIGTLRGGHLVVSVGCKSQDLNWLPYAPLGGRRGGNALIPDELHIRTPV
jgi:hypothetical protein